MSKYKKEITFNSGRGDISMLLLVRRDSLNRVNYLCVSGCYVQAIIPHLDNILTSLKIRNPEPTEIMI